MTKGFLKKCEVIVLRYVAFKKYYQLFGAYNIHTGRCLILGLSFAMFCDMSDFFMIGKHYLNEGCLSDLFVLSSYLMKIVCCGLSSLLACRLPDGGQLPASVGFPSAS